MKVLNWVAMILVLVGGLNWGLVGFFDYDLVASIFGDMTTMSRVVYDLVGIAALYGVFAFPMSMSKMSKTA